MTKESFNDVLNDALVQAGRSGRGVQLTDDNLATVFINEWLKRCWEFAWWPGITRIEPRHFAPVYDPGALYESGDTVYHPASKAHYECLGTITATAPTDADNVVNAQYWAVVAASFTAADYDSTKTYAQGDLVTFRDDGRVYQSRIAGNTTSPDDATNGTARWGLRTPFTWKIANEQSEPARALRSSPTSVGWSADVAFAYGNDVLAAEPGMEFLISSVANEVYNGRWSLLRASRSDIYFWALGVNPGGTSTGGTVTTYRRPIGHVRNIWAADPRVTDYAESYPAQRVVDGVISTLQQGTVWLEYRDRCPRMTTTDYSATATYAAGDRMRYTDGYCYTAVLATTAGQTPATHPGKWEQLFIPGYLREAVALGAAGDLKQHQQGNDAGLIARAWDRLKREYRELSIDQSQHRSLSVPWARQRSGNCNMAYL